MSLLAGIRFFGQDVERPFVELLAWDGPRWPSPDEWSTLRRAVAREWSAFAPAAVRLFHPPDLSMPEDAALDLSLHAAPYAAMGRSDVPAGARFASATDGAVAAALVAARYREFRADDMVLARDLAPIEEDALRALMTEGRVMSIEWRERAVGLLAWESGSVEWLRGDVVAEEVVLGEASGQGLAAAAQRELARRQAERAPGTLLLGTILAANHASRRTALRAGRPEIARYSFLPIRRAEP